MLEESQELFDKLKKSHEHAQIKSLKRKATLVKCKKWIIRIGIPFLIVVVFAFPKQSGHVIGTWINDFFVTIIKEAIK